MTWQGIILRGTDCATLSIYSLDIISVYMFAEKLEVETTPVILILYFAPKTLLNFTRKDIASRNEEYASLKKFGRGKLPSGVRLLLKTQSREKESARLPD